MQEHRFVTLDVFTDQVFGGNQLAVFPDARAIPESHLLPMTREFNFSEVTFCYPPADAAHSARVRIFTPGGEVPFAGHPTIGTAIALVGLGKVGNAKGESTLVLEEKVGPVPVTVRIDGGAPFAQFSVAQLPEIGPRSPTRQTLAAILSLESDDLLQAPTGPQPVSCGLPWLIVPVRSVEALGRARLRIEKWEATLRSSWAPNPFVFAPDADGDPTHYRARCFVPGFNIPEDPATGSACASFAGYLAARSAKKDGTLAWTVDQGVEMGRPSRIAIEADRSAGTITAVRVGGSAVFVTEGTFRTG